MEKKLCKIQRVLAVPTIIEYKTPYESHRTCSLCDWFEAEFSRCELNEVDADSEDDACKNFIQEEK
jgi:hypothetical protein